jgi:hypothetical protein
MSNSENEFPDPSEVVVECQERKCGTETTAADLSQWQASNDPDEVVLCPSCAARVPNNNQTPSEMRESNNQKITEFTP